MDKHDESVTDLIRARDVRGFESWALPSFDPPKPEPEPEPEPNRRKWKKCRWKKSSH